MHFLSGLLFWYNSTEFCYKWDEFQLIPFNCPTKKKKKLSAKICSAKKVFCSLTFVIQMHLHQAVFQKPNKINPKVTNLSSCDLGHLCCSVLYCWSAVKGKYSGKLTKKYCCIAVYISTYFFKVLHRVWSLGVVGRSRHIFSAVYRAGEG